MTNIVTSYFQRIIGDTSFKREKIWTRKVGGVRSVADKNHKYMFVTVNDIKRIKSH